MGQSKDGEGRGEVFHALMLFIQRGHVGPVIVDMGYPMTLQHLSVLSADEPGVRISTAYMVFRKRLKKTYRWNRTFACHAMALNSKKRPGVGSNLASWYGFSTNSLKASRPGAGLACPALDP